MDCSQTCAAVAGPDRAAPSQDHSGESNPQKPDGGRGREVAKEQEEWSRRFAGGKPTSCSIAGRINLCALLAQFPLSLVFLETEFEARAIFEPKTLMHLHLTSPAQQKLQEPHRNAGYARLS